MQLIQKTAQCLRRDIPDEDIPTIHRNGLDQTVDSVDECRFIIEVRREMNFPI
jgi:hypothetical protein